MRIRGLLFDKDGTLLDYHASWMPLNRAVALFAADGDEAVALRLLVSGGFDPATGRIRANTPLAVGTPTEIGEAFTRELGGPVCSDLGKEVDRLFQEGAGFAALVPEAKAAVAKFRGRVTHMGVATSDSMAGLKASLGPHGLIPHFDFLAAFDSGHGIKPGPGMALAFCKACGLAPAEIAVIGDNLHDIDMGRSAGAGLTIGVLTGTSAADDLAGHADRIYPGIAEMAADPELMGWLA